MNFKSKKIIISNTIGFYLIFIFFLLFKQCATYAVICSPYADFNYGKRIPFSCDQVCYSHEYNYGVIKAILLFFTLPIIIIYIILYLFAYGINYIIENKNTKKKD
jgi:hypothetical protein